MATTTAVQDLQAVGFSEYEARAYTTLLERGPLTGYQLAKESAIPRPNIYPVVDRLEARGAVTRIAVAAGVKYAALPAAEMLARLARDVQAHLADAEASLAAIPERGAPPYVWNVEGYDAALARAEEAIAGARSSLVMALWSVESRRLAPAVEAAQARGVAITVLCVEGCAGECGGCRGEIFRYPVSGETARRWLMVVPDQRLAVLAQVGAGNETRGVQTELPMLVALTTQYVQNAIAVAEIVRSIGRKLPGLVDDRARDALEGIELAGAGEPWLQRIVRLIGRHRS